MITKHLFPLKCIVVLASLMLTCNDDPSLINKHATVMGVKSDQVKAFLQGTEQGNYNIIFLHPGDIQDKNESAKFNLQLVLARDHFITKDYDPTEWKQIDLKTAENLFKNTTIWNKNFIR